MYKHQDEEQEFFCRPNVYCIDRTIYFFSEINETSVCEAIKILDVLEKQKVKKPIEILLNSPGGQCYAGLSLYDRIRHSKCHICIIGSGIIASMAFIIFLAGETRYVHKNAILMNHQISSMSGGKLSDLKIDLEETKRIEKQCLAIISERTGQTIKAIEKQIAKGDDYITPERALKEGIASKII
jgi:ATP-dependent Clp protease protease subunit